MKLRHLKHLSPYLVWSATALFLLILAWWAQHPGRSYVKPSLLTGWVMLGLMLGLAAFNARKRLSMLAVGKASTWLSLHFVGGLIALPLFWLHTRTLWPAGRYEQAMALLFYGISFTGVAGYALQKIYPRLLTATGVEIIYERIPSEIAALRQEAESLILDCCRQTSSNTLARHYMETFDWLFRCPRFIFNHALGGNQAKIWRQKQCAMVERYLNPEERQCLEKLSALADYKSDVDYHYTAQSIMKLWLLIHLPIAVGLMILILWHVLVVHIYAV